MDFSTLLGGFQEALSLHNVLYCGLGVLIGTIVGMLPGLGASSGMALLLPLTLGLSPTTALILLAGIYYGTQYGGTISSVLVAIPGEASTVVSAVDGHQLALKGRAGPALAIAAIASFVAGTISIVLLMVAAPLVSRIALKFGPPETFALLLFGMLSISSFSSGRMAKGIAMGGLGLLLGTVGIDAQSGVARFSFDSTQLLGGIGFIEVLIGLFAVSEIIKSLGQGAPPPIRTRFRDMMITRTDLREMTGPTLRQSGQGFLLGMLPGAGASVASFLAYDVERRIYKGPKKWGTGVVAALAGPEAANNAAANGAFAPTLALGIPGSGATAILLGAFLLFGIQPGPLVMVEQSDLVWALLASFYIGNVLLLILNLPLAPVFGSLLRVRYAYLYPAIVVFGFLGAYAVENRMWGIWVAFVAGIVGYGLDRLGYPLLPIVMGLILGPMMEEAFVQAHAMGGESFAVFLHRPIALVILALCVVAVVMPGVLRMRRRLIARRAAPDDATDDEPRMSAPVGPHGSA